MDNNQQVVFDTSSNFQADSLTQRDREGNGNRKFLKQTDLCSHIKASSGNEGSQNNFISSHTHWMVENKKLGDDIDIVSSEGVYCGFPIHKCYLYSLQ